MSYWSLRSHQDDQNMVKGSDSDRNCACLLIPQKYVPRIAVNESRFFFSDD